MLQTTRKDNSNFYFEVLRYHILSHSSLTTSSCRINKYPMKKIINWILNLVQKRCYQRCYDKSSFVPDQRMV